ncbi:MAG TPA: cyclase family protein [Gammaproteobacteria bacterium]|nr:cyclase family protein [Gammaproteobacteria bacterium]
MTAITFEAGGRRYRCDTAAGRSLAIRLDFNGQQPNFFGAPPAQKETFAAGGFVGDTRSGGSCNVGVYRLNPHCNGTHTECIGHVVDDDITVADLNVPGIIPATLITIDTGGAPAIGLNRVQDALQQWQEEAFHRALIIRTLPNEIGKQSQHYDSSKPPPYLAAAAARLVREVDVEHLLVDLPSLDAMNDNALIAHRIFWGLPSGSRSCAKATHPQATITEMIYASDEVIDGYYLLNLQVPAFATDAAPSRPILLPIEAVAR